MAKKASFVKQKQEDHTFVLIIWKTDTLDAAFQRERS